MTNSDMTMRWIPIYVGYDEASTSTNEIKGYQCNHCGFFTSKEREICPFCKRRSEEKRNEGIEQ